MIWKIILLSEFEYPGTATQTDPKELYDTIKYSSYSNVLVSITVFFCVLVGFYMVLVSLCWCIEHYGYLHNNHLFRLVTFGKGDAKAVTLKKLIIINAGVVLAICSIISGLIPEIIVKVFKGILNLINLIL